MKKYNFKKIDNNELENNYGGFNLLAALSSALPVISGYVKTLLGALFGGVGAYKMITTDTGKYKGEGVDTNWSAPKPSSSTTATKTPTVNQVFYPY